MKSPSNTINCTVFVTATEIEHIGFRTKKDKQEDLYSRNINGYIEPINDNKRCVKKIEVSMPAL